MPTGRSRGQPTTAAVKHEYRTHAQGLSAKLNKKALKAVSDDPGVAFVEADQLMTLSTTQTDATWGLDRIDQRTLPLNGTYNYTPTGAGVTAYIIDTGLRTTHNEFGGRASGGFDAIDGLPADDCTRGAPPGVRARCRGPRTPGDRRPRRQRLTTVLSAPERPGAAANVPHRASGGNQAMTDETRAENAIRLGSMSIRSERDGDTYVVELIGELDLDGAPAVEEELLHSEDSDATSIVVDLSRLEFIDSTGIRLIVMAAKRCDEGRLTLRRGPKQVHRVFEVTDLADRLPFADA